MRTEFFGSINRRGGGKSAKGQLLKARNCRYMSGRPESIFFLLGRNKYNRTVASPALPTSDWQSVKQIFTAVYDNGTKKLVMHRGGSLFEGDLTDVLVGAQEMSESFALNIIPNSITPRGVSANYNNVVYYMAGSNNWSNHRHFLARTPTAWRLGGHRTPTATFTVTPYGTGDLFGSEIRYTYRIYDSTTDTESAHGPVVTVNAPAGDDGSGYSSFRLTFPAGVTTAGELGTHLRIYQTLYDQPPGLYFRADNENEGAGIALASVTAGYVFACSLPNTDMEQLGIVRADGEEGTVAWAEHGGPPPVASGCMVWKDVMLTYGIVGNKARVIYSATAYPECFPVDWDGNYVYYLDFQSSESDEVQCLSRAGTYCLVMLNSSIWRVSSWPTLEDPGFNRQIKDHVTLDHGVCGPYAAAPVTVSKRQGSITIYVSSSRELMWTDGVFVGKIAPGLAFENLVNYSYINQVEVVDYPSKEECWIFYPNGESTVNNQAIIVSYSDYERLGLRITWPIDVREKTATHGICLDGQPRFFIAGDDDGIVYVQDEDSGDDQNNYDTNGNIRVEIETCYQAPATGVDSYFLRRGFLHGDSGEERTISINLTILLGDKRYTQKDTAKVGDGETKDVFMADVVGSQFKHTLTFTGKVGSNYDPDSATRTTRLDYIEYEVEDGGPIPRTDEGTT